MAKKRDRTDEEPEDDIDNDVYDDEEDEEEESARKKKGSKRKRKKKSHSVIDMEAEEDDAEEDEEDDEDGETGRQFVIDNEDDAEFNREREHTRRQRFDHKRTMQIEDHQELERMVRERYENMDDDVGAPDTSGIDQQSLLPTIRDPRLYMVRCTKPGHERKAIFSLLQKKFNLQRKNLELGILSAVAPEHLKGRIYIEAHSAAQVQLAVNGLTLISTKNALKMVDVDEMPDVLKLGKRPDKQVNGNWVRIKRRDHIYHGDLAQVCNMREGSNDGYVTIRLIPRLDLKSEKDLIENKDDVYDTENAGSRRKGRPPQMLFDRKELYRLTGSGDVVSQRNRDTGEIFDVWNDNMYRFGLLYIQRVNVKSLVVGDAVQPTVEELETWIIAEKHMRMMFEDDPSSMDAEVAARGLELDVNSVAGRRKTKLFKGDSVRVTHGEQRGLEGKIESINQDVVMVRIPEISDPIQVNRAHITKTFKVGEHVKVSSGKNAGNTGAIVGVEGDFLTIFSDTTREEIKVLSSQVADSADAHIDVTPNRGSMGSASQQAMRFELFDLVQMVADPNEKGVIIQVQNDTLTLLTPQNTRKLVNVASVKRKNRDDSVRALDARGNPIAPNDTVHVLRGPMLNRTGVVKHVAGRIVFFKARDEVNNCGLLAVLASQCSASTAAARRLTSTISGNPNAKNPTPIPRGAVGMYTAGGRGGRGGGGAGRGRGGGGGGMGRDPLIRKEVKVKSGQYKGYTGKVLDANERTVRVELTSRMKTVNLPRDRVKEVGGPGEGSEHSGRGGSMNQGNNRNMHNGGGGKHDNFSGYQQRTGNGGAGGNLGGMRINNSFNNNRSNFHARTPRNDGSFSRTPGPAERSMYGATPRPGGLGGMGGHQTPSHIPNGLATPSHNDFTPITRPSFEFGSSTPVASRVGISGGFGGGGSATPASATSGGAGGSFRPIQPPRTPVADANPYTPYMPQTPATPAAPHAAPLMPTIPATPMASGHMPGGPGAGSVDGSTMSSGGITASNNANLSTTSTTNMVPNTPVSTTSGHHHQPSALDTYGGGMEPRTPGMPVEPSTPAYAGLEPRTPAPGGLEPATPAPILEPRTPAPGGQEPHTPGPGMEPSTPMVLQEPQTPHTPANLPQTPHPQEDDSGRAGGGGTATSELGYRVLVDVEVLVNSMNNFSAKVVSAAADGSVVRVRMLSGDHKGQEIGVPLSDITPVQPRPEVGEVQELVKVLDGAYAGRIGRLQTVQTGHDDMEGLIKFTDGQEATLNMSLVAKCSEDDS